MARPGKPDEIDGRAILDAIKNHFAEQDEVANPIERFHQLPEPTRRWIEELREEDLSDIDDAVRFYRNARTIGRFNKWLIITAVGAFVGVVALGEGIQKFMHWIGFGGRP